MNVEINDKWLSRRNHYHTTKNDNFARFFITTHLPLIIRFMLHIMMLAMLTGEVNRFLVLFLYESFHFTFGGGEKKKKKKHKRRIKSSLHCMSEWISCVWVAFIMTSSLDGFIVIFLLSLLKDFFMTLMREYMKKMNRNFLQHQIEIFYLI